MNIDLLSISGHKLYGPKGIGALYVNRKPRVRLVPIINGGGQERGHRSGTLPTALIVGLGAASRVAKQEIDNDRGNGLGACSCYSPAPPEHTRRLFFRLLDGLKKNIPEIVVNGDLGEQADDCSSLF